MLQNLLFSTLDKISFSSVNDPGIVKIVSNILKSLNYQKPLFKITEKVILDIVLHFHNDL